MFGDENNRVFDVLDKVTDTGIYIEVGSQFIPVATENTLTAIEIDTDIFLETQIKVENAADYDTGVRAIRTLKSNLGIVKVEKNNLREPAKTIDSAIVDRFNPLEQKIERAINLQKDANTEFKVKHDRALEEERAEKQKKADEEAAKVKKAMKDVAEENKKKKELLVEQRKAEQEKEKSLERERIEKQKAARILAQQKKDEEAKKAITVDPVEMKKIEQQIVKICEEKNAVDEIVKKIEVEVKDQSKKIRSIAREEIDTNNLVKTLESNSETYTVKPEETVIKPLPPLHRVSHPRRIKHRVVDPTIVPDYYKKTIIDEEKIKDAVRQHGLDTQIPGVEVYEEIGMSTGKN